MPMPFRPWIEWGFEGDLSEWTASLPMLPWTPADGGVGGSATAASGIPEAYRIRLDRIVHMELRIHEDELASFRAFLIWARDSGTSFTFRLDQDNAATEISAHLHAPRWEDESEVRYQRDPEYPRVFRVPLSVRTRLGGAITTLWREAE